MASSLSTVGVPEVSPNSGAAPFQKTSASPAAFGADKAQALEGLGQAGVKTGDYFGEVVVDDQTNQLFDRWNKRLRGDPNQSITGPDGSKTPDTGYLGLKGRNALDARKDFEKGLDDDLNQVRTGLTSAKQQQRFDDQTRRYRQHVKELASGHADTQAGVYATNVNKASISIALTHIVSNFGNINEVKAGIADLTASRVKDAQIAGGGEEMVRAAKESALRDGTKAWLEAYGAEHPNEALKQAEKNRIALGTSFDEVHRSLRERAYRMTGFQEGEKAMVGTYSTVPAPSQVVPIVENAARQYGVSTNYLLRTWQLESGGKINPADSSTGAKGPFQVVGGTAKQYGLTDPHDFTKSANTAAQLAANNATYLTNTLGHAPTDAEIYLAHQQGAGGATALLRNPGLPAADALSGAYFRQAGGDRAKARELAANAIRVNGGDPEAPASSFTSMWTARFNGSALSHTLATRKAEAYQAIVANPDLNQEERQHALTYVNQTIASQQIAEGQLEKKQKEDRDNAADAYVQRMQRGDYSGMAEQINTDPRLAGDYKLRDSLFKMAEKGPDEGAEAAKRTYGSGYFTTMQSILSDANDPSHVSDPSSIYKRAIPGGDLTMAGAQKLVSVMKEVTKSVNNDSVHTAKAGLLSYARSAMAKEQLVPGATPIVTNKKGLEIFNAKFLPQYEAEYDAHVASGKNPYEFLTQKKADEIMDRVYPRSERAKDTLAGGGDFSDDKNQPVPPTPKGANPATWGRLMSSPPLLADGKPLSRKIWADKLGLLLANPTPENIELFNSSRLGTQGGYEAKKLIDQLSGKAEPIPEGVPRPGAFRS